MDWLVRMENVYMTHDYKMILWWVLDFEDMEQFGGHSYNDNREPPHQLAKGLVLQSIGFEAWQQVSHQVCQGLFSSASKV